jgi:hypothetical protein
MPTTTIAQPPFTYITFSFFLFNLIQKNCSLSLNVESIIFFLALSFLGFFCLLVFCVFELLLFLFFSTLVLQLQQEQQQP